MLTLHLVWPARPTGSISVASVPPAARAADRVAKVTTVSPAEVVGHLQVHYVATDPSPAFLQAKATRPAKGGILIVSGGYESASAARTLGLEGL